MIAMLHGTVFEKTPGYAIIECSGVGYEVVIPLGTFSELPPVGNECILYTRHVIREDDELLFGFATKEERSTFDLLVTVSGVGPKLAITVIDGLSVQDFRRAVVNGDAKRLGQIKGIGKKTAERIVVDLKGKIDPIEAMAGTSGAAQIDAAARDAVLALSQLGFNQEAAFKMVQSAIESGVDKSQTDALVRAALSASRK